MESSILGFEDAQIIGCLVQLFCNLMVRLLLNGYYNLKKYSSHTEHSEEEDVFIIAKDVMALGEFSIVFHYFI